MKRLLPAALLLLAACGSDPSRVKSDWELAHEGQLVRQGAEATPIAPPAIPRGENLVRFFVTSASDFTFFVDAPSVSVGADGVVRYTLVARSPSGVDNVTYEGLNCKAAEFVIYAIGQSDGRWRTAPGRWQPIERRSVQRWHNVLAAEYFCPNGIPIGDAAEGVGALRRGGHPWARSPTDAPSGR